MAITGSKTAIVDAQPLKPRYSRTRSGCLTCRARRKKCEGPRPQCAGCDRNRLVCTWPKSPTSRLARDGPRRAIAPQRLPATSYSHAPLSLASLDQQAGRECESQQAPSEAGTPASKCAVLLLSPASTGVSRTDASRLSTTGSAQQPRLLQSLSSFSSSILLEGDSWLLIQHYMQKTAAVASPMGGETNPFVVQVMPLAMRSDILMHTVLAFSACHRNRTLDLVPHESTPWTHYAAAIRQLQQGVTKLTTSDKDGTMVFLVTMLLLCLVEAVSGDVRGALYCHLRAAGPLLTSFLSLPDGYVGDEMRTFVIELYLCLTTVANITLNAYTDDRIIDYDHNLHSLSKLHGSKAFGVFLGCAHELYEIIPQVSKLAKLRLLQQAGVSGPVEETAIYFKSLENKIICWKPRTLCADQGLTLSGLIFQQGLLAFLYASYYCEDTGNMKFHTLIRQVEDITASLLDQVDFTNPSTTMLVWPLTILGSCASEPLMRQKISETLTGIYLQLRMAPPNETLKELLWDDPVLFGPLGLEQIMLRHEIILGMA